MKFKDYASDVDTLLAELGSERSSDQKPSEDSEPPSAVIVDEIFTETEETADRVHRAGVIPERIATHVPEMTQRSVVPENVPVLAKRQSIGMLDRVRNLLNGKPRQRPSVYRRLSEGQNLEPRMALDGASLAMDVGMMNPEGEFSQGTEVVAERRTIDFRALQHGTHPQEWTTNIEGLGNVTLWFEGGTVVDQHGVSAVIQPWGGTSWSMRFRDKPVKLFAAELDFMGTSPRGQLDINLQGNILRENCVIKYFPLETSVDFGGRIGDTINQSQNSGRVAVKSLTVEVTVTKEKPPAVEEQAQTPQRAEDVQRSVANPDATPDIDAPLAALLTTIRADRAAAQARLNEMLARPEGAIERATVTVTADPVTSGLIEAKNVEYDPVHRAGIEGSRNPSLQVGQQYWIYNNIYLGWRVVLDFDLQKIPQNATIEGASLTLQGTKKLNITNENIALHVVGVTRDSAGKPSSFAEKSFGSTGYDDFATDGANVIKLDASAMKPTSNGRLELGLRINQDLQHLAPSRSGNNAYVFYVGSTTDAATVPKLEVTYAVKTRPSSASEEKLLQEKIASLDAMIRTLMQQERGSDATAIGKQIGFILSAYSVLSRIDALTQPWTIEGMPHRMTLIRDRGEALTTAARDLTALGETLPPLLTLVTREAPVELENIAERVQTASLQLAGSIGEWQREQEIFDAEPWHVLSDASRERLSVNTPPPSPTFSIANLSGPNATLFFRGSPEGRTVRLMDMGSPGDLGSRTVVSSHEGAEQSATVTINAQNPGGIYRVALLDAKQKMLASLQLLWNQETKVLSLVDKKDAFVPVSTVRDDGSLPYAELFGRAKSEEDRQVLVAGAAAAKEQLFSGVASAIPSGYVPDFNRNLSKIFRENSQMQLLDLASASGVNFTLTGEQVRRAFLELNPEFKRIGSGSFEADKGYFMNRFNQTFVGYYQAIAQLLQKSMDTILASRQGKNIDTQEYWRGLHTIVDPHAFAPQLFAARLAGVREPNAGTMFAAVQAIYDHRFDEFLAFQDSTYREMQARQEEFKNWQPEVSKATKEAEALAKEEKKMQPKPGMDASESARVVKAQVKARDAAIARGLTGEALQMYNRGVILAQENHSKVLGGAVVYAYGAPRDGDKMNFDTVLKSEGLGTVEDRLLAHVNAFPGSRKFLAGLPLAQQVLIGDIQRKQNPTDTAFLQFLSPSAQEQVREIVAREESPTVKVSGEVGVASRALVAGVGYFPSTLKPAYNVYQYGIIPSEGKVNDERIPIAPRGLEMITFTLKDRMMVNLSTAAADMGEIDGALLNTSKPNIDFTLFGKENPETFSSRNKGVSGESISRILKPGTYYLMISDATSYKGLTTKEMEQVRLPQVPVHVEFKRFNSANIEGKISIEGSPKVMPVSMRVAEFDSGGQRNVNYDGKDVKKKPVNTLNPNLPVWIITHGRVNSEESSQIVELTRNLQALGVQIVTLDWHEGAEDNVIPFVGLEGSKWIEATGTWGANQLKAVGFTSENINVIGHSWGSYVSYEIGAHIPGGVKTLVALDPATDNVLIGGGKYKGFRDPNFKFSHVASNSYAMRSSDLSDQKKALSAEYSFEVRVPEGYENGLSFKSPLEKLAYDYVNGGILPGTIDKGKDAMREHSFAVSLFTELLLRQKLNPSDPTASIFSLENLRSEADEVLKKDGLEGFFFVNPSWEENDIGTEVGTHVWKARTFGFAAKDRNGNDIINPRTL